jgi:amino acid permease
MFLLPLAMILANGNEFVLYLTHIDAGSEGGPVIQGEWPLYITLGITVILLCANIFGYRNRKAQGKLGRFLYLFIIAVLLVTVMMLRSNTEALLADESSTSYGFGFYMPVAALAFNFLANRAIKKDENLVRSVDRLR